MQLKSFLVAESVRNIIPIILAVLKLRRTFKMTSQTTLVIFFVFLEYPMKARWPCSQANFQGIQRYSTAGAVAQLPQKQVLIAVYGYHPVLIEPVATLALDVVAYGSLGIHAKKGVRQSWFGVSFLKGLMRFQPHQSDRNNISNRIGYRVSSFNSTRHSKISVCMFLGFPFPITDPQSFECLTSEG